jgi:DNA-binding beta-propeller fold protein YncE
MTMREKAMKMSSYQTRPNRAWQVIAALTVLLAMAVASPHAAAADKKNKKSGAATQQKRERIAFDVRKLVWPNPPAIARIRYVNLLTGEAIDPSLYETKGKKKKQGWMDRLAGSDTDAQISDAKIPYQLIRPYGVAVDSKGRIYTADQGVDAIFIFNIETKAVELIRNGHEAHFGMINGLAIDDNDRLFVSDMKLRQVLVFNANHQQEGAFGNEVLGRPGGIALDVENRFLYVVDTENDVVDVFDADSFKLLRKIGTPGKKHVLTEPGTFSLPSSVAVDKDGNVYVTDTLNNRVEIFDADGKFISMFGKNGDGPADFTRPKGIAVDCDGNIWVIDTYQDKVKIFNQQGRLLAYVGDHGDYPGQFKAAFGIAIDKNNRVITSEQWPGRLQIFRYVTEAEVAELQKEQDKDSKGEPKAPEGMTKQQASSTTNAGATKGPNAQ